MKFGKPCKNPQKQPKTQKNGPKIRIEIALILLFQPQFCRNSAAILPRLELRARSSTVGELARNAAAAADATPEPPLDAALPNADGRHLPHLHPDMADIPLANTVPTWAFATVPAYALQTGAAAVSREPPFAPGDEVPYCPLDGSEGNGTCNATVVYDPNTPVIACTALYAWLWGDLCISGSSRPALTRKQAESRRGPIIGRLSFCRARCTTTRK